MPCILDSIQSRDFNISSTLREFARDRSIPVTVLGNGGSLSELSEDDIEYINKTRLLRCNWAFLDPSKIKKEYIIYFSQAYGNPGEKELSDQLDEAITANNVSIFKYQDRITYTDQSHVSLMDDGGRPVWSTTGIQMLLYATYILQCSKINIAGMDLYTYNRPSRSMGKEDIIKYLNTHGKTFSRSPKESAGVTTEKGNLTYITPEVWRKLCKDKKATWHYIETDILLIFKCFTKAITSNIVINIIKNPAMSEIYKITNKNIDLLSEYFSNPTLSAPTGVYYNTWRLINSTANTILPE
tara:strand:+ start:279 stop:1172 length:894 start_codon:yes stop_codon:yes gene_type:complete